MDGSEIKITLKFGKRIEKKNLAKSVLDCNHAPKDGNEKHNLIVFDESILPLKNTVKNEELIIPLIENDSKRLLLKKTTEISHNKKQENQVLLQESSALTLDEKAAAEILKESKQQLEVNFSEKHLIEVPRSTDVYEEEKLLPVAETSTLEDYERVNIECFGSALLRGMGWSKDTGIGKNNKRVIEMVTPTSKGFALTNSLKKSKEVSSDSHDVECEEEEELIKGSYVFIHSGRNRGLYGVVECIDDDHLLFRPSRGGKKVLREVEQNVRVVSAKEFKESSRVINKEMYDEFKLSEENKKKKRNDDSKKDSYNGERDSERPPPSQHKKYLDSSKSIRGDDRRLSEPKEKELKIPMNTTTKIGKSESSLKQDKNDVEKVNTKSDDRRYSKAHKYREDKSRGETNLEERKHKSHPSFAKYSQPDRMPEIPWATENLRVRIIDRKYKGGKYYKEKVIVESVETICSCTCVTDSGKRIEDLDPRNLETVIPKTPMATVLIVKGKHKGLKGRVLELNKDREAASIQLLQEQSVVIKCHYDDICEYINR